MFGQVEGQLQYVLSPAITCMPSWSRSAFQPLTGGAIVALKTGVGALRTNVDWLVLTVSAVVPGTAIAAPAPLRTPTETPSNVNTAPTSFRICMPLA